MATRNAPDSRETAPWWADETGLIHICESDAPLGTELLIWTLCDREVEPGAAFVPSKHHVVSCGKCAAAEGILKRRGASVPRATACP